MSSDIVAVAQCGQPDKDWDSLRLAIRDLYLVENVELSELMSTMSSRYGFSASKWQYEKKLKEWEFFKNIPKKYWAYIDNQARRMQRDGQGISIYLSGVKKPWKSKTLNKKRRDNHYHSYSCLATAPESPTGISLMVASSVQEKEFQFTIHILPWYSFVKIYRQGTLPATQPFLQNGLQIDTILRMIQSSTDSPGAYSYLTASLIEISLMVFPQHDARIQHTDSESSGQTLDHLTPRNPFELLLLLLSNNMLVGHWTVQADRQLIDFLRQNGLWKKLWDMSQDSQQATAQAILEKVFAGAVRLGDIEVIRMFLDAGTPVDRIIHVLYHSGSIEKVTGRYRGLATPLQVAICVRNLKLVKFLLPRHPNTFLRRKSRHIIGLAIKAGKLEENPDQEMLKHILSTLQPLTENQFCHALKAATRSGNRDARSALLEVLPPENRSGKVNSRLLIDALKNNDQEFALKVLVESPNLNLEGHYGIVALWHAIIHEEAQVCRKLLDRGASSVLQLVNNQVFPKSPADIDGISGPLYNIDSTVKRCCPTLLQCAAYIGNIEILDMLLERDADIDFQVPRGWRAILRGAQYELIYLGKTALHAALLASRDGVAMHMLQRGAKLIGGELVMAVRNRCHVVRDELLSLGMPLHDVDLSGHNVLVAAIITLDLVLINKIIDSDSRNITPECLCAAVYMDIATTEPPIASESLTRIILNRGKDRLGDGGFEGLAIAFAGWNGRADIVELLLTNGLRPTRLRCGIDLSKYQWKHFESLEIWTEKYGFWHNVHLHMDESVMISILRSGDTASLELLLGYGYEFEPQMEFFDLYISLDTCRLLKKAGRNLSQHFPRNGRWLQIAIEYHNWAVAKWLLENGADVNEVPARYYGRTALQAAVEAGNMELIDILIARRAHINAPPAFYAGATAFQCASLKGYIRIAERLVKLNADIDAPGSDYTGRTALEGAAEQGHIDMISFLLDIPVATTGPCQRQYIRAVKFAQSMGHNVAANLIIAHRPWTEEDHLTFNAEKTVEPIFRQVDSNFLVSDSERRYAASESEDSTVDSDTFTTEEANVDVDSQSEQGSIEFGEQEMELDSHDFGNLPIREVEQTFQMQSGSEERHSPRLVVEVGQSAVTQGDYLDVCQGTFSQQDEIVGSYPVINDVWMGANNEVSGVRHGTDMELLEYL